MREEKWKPKKSEYQSILLNSLQHPKQIIDSKDSKVPHQGPSILLYLVVVITNSWYSC